jgi:phospho-N-acetylmuramoyl-pentapeptide-transferase
VLYHFLVPLTKYVKLFNLFNYISFRAAGAAVTALLVAFIVGPFILRRLQSLMVHQGIREGTPDSHLNKGDTPTMGGLIILAATLIPTLLWAKLDNRYILLALLVTAWMGAIGFLDDYLKISKKNKKGLPGKLKLLGQFVIGAGAMIWLYHSDALPADVRLRLALPLVNFHHMSGAWLSWTTLPFAAYVAFAVFVLMAESNAVNLTDGLDGLAIGPVIICSFTFLFLSYAAGTTLRAFNIAEYLGMAHVPGAGELAVFCGAVGGAGIGFLWYNTHPAQVFMGDVGALALGGAIGFVALATKTELSLPLIGGVFVAEAVSDIIQVAYYKKTKKRIFLMAPIHHHFEKLGWPESRIVVRFWIVSFACAILGLITTLKVR